MDSKANIIKKILGCMALSKSTNPNEAALALKKARQLMDKYEISESDLAVAEIQQSSAELSVSRSLSAHQRILVSMVGKLFKCEYYVRPNYTVSFSHNEIVFVGYDASAEVASYCFDVLNRQLRKARKEFIKTHLKRVRSRQRKTYRADSFCLGWVHGVARNVEHLIPPEPKESDEPGLMKVNQLKAFVDDICQGHRSRNKSQSQSPTKDAMTGFIVGLSVQVNAGVAGGGKDVKTIEQ